MIFALRSKWSFPRRLTFKWRGWNKVRFPNCWRKGRRTLTNFEDQRRRNRLNQRGRWLDRQTQTARTPNRRFRKRKAIHALNSWVKTREDRSALEVRHRGWRDVQPKAKRSSSAVWEGHNVPFRQYSRLAFPKPIQLHPSAHLAGHFESSEADLSLIHSY